ncbi:hypothetical protein ABMA28_003447 [Loxostege sticticalis]|uniref:Reverse transcriptase domain-containing protein n=1 Tax=Loxostege sticticalis TaxID=481309 RepID=A0ABD0SW50_LOXSC
MFREIDFVTILLCHNFPRSLLSKDLFCSNRYQAEAAYKRIYILHVYKRISKLLTLELINKIDSLSVGHSEICDPTDVRTKLQTYSSKNSLKLLTQNIRSISANMNSFSVLLNNIDTNLDFIILTECWLPKQSHIPSLDGISQHSCFPWPSTNSYPTHSKSILSAMALHSNSHTLSRRRRILKPWITPGLLRCIRNRDGMHKKLKRDPNNNILRHVNSFFAGVGESLAEDILKHQPRASSSSSLSPKNLLSGPPPSSNSQSFVLLDTNPAEVESLISSLKEDCAVGWDNISTTLLKRCKDVLVPPITHICNLCLSNSCFPDAFKKALVHPIHKSGDRSRPNNYRPISVLPALSKILERLINNRLTDFLENRHLLSPCQFGFRSGRSTADAVHVLTDHLVRALDRGKKYFANLCLFSRVSGRWQTRFLSREFILLCASLS